MKKILLRILLIFLVVTLTIIFIDHIFFRNDPNHKSTDPKMSWFKTYAINDNEVGILSFVGKPTEDTLIIPNKIGGRTVVEIGEEAF